MPNAEIGKVLQVSDGVVRIYGLDHAEAGELLDCGNGVMAVVMNLEPDNVGAVLMGPTDLLKEGAVVRRTRRIASIPVGEALVGRVVDPLPWSARLRASSTASRCTSRCRRASRPSTR